MYTPLNTPIFASMAPIATIDVSLNTLLGISWHLLLPYTIFGVGLMVYSQSRLIIGQRELKRSEKLEVDK